MSECEKWKLYTVFDLILLYAKCNFLCDWILRTKLRTRSKHTFSIFHWKLLYSSKLIYFHLFNWETYFFVGFIVFGISCLLELRGGPGFDIFLTLLYFINCWILYFSFSFCEAAINQYSDSKKVPLDTTKRFGRTGYYYICRGNLNYSSLREWCMFYFTKCFFTGVRYYKKKALRTPVHYRIQPMQWNIRLR